MGVIVLIGTFCTGTTHARASLLRATSKARRPELGESECTGGCCGSCPSSCSGRTGRFRTPLPGCGLLPSPSSWPRGERLQPAGCCPNSGSGPRSWTRTRSREQSHTSARRGPRPPCHGPAPLWSTVGATTAPPTCGASLSTSPAPISTKTPSCPPAPPSAAPRTPWTVLAASTCRLRHLNVRARPRHIRPAVL